ncbi:2-acyl-1-lysophosphatidylinositol acyltransferase [Trichomonascus vanleenenianus]|uniref:lysophospholipid acyltransferase family protein n=1 Tax=Trichomonascus vanleenenianus TaxID=2268995 RepID=UPI003EC9851A
MTEKESARAEVVEPHAYSKPIQAFRAVTVVFFTIVASLCIYGTQAIGYPIKFVAPEVYRAWIDITKQSYGIYLTSMNQLWTPTEAVISGDKSMEGLFSLNPDGTLKTNFGGHTVLISNHQLYSDWAYLWWIAFTARMHGAVYIILKASLKWIPIIGWGMQNYRFIFLSRKWMSDEKVLKEGLDVVADMEWPSWLILFPEGTTMSSGGFAKSEAYAKKTDLEMPKHLLLPRATGLRYSLQRLAETVEYVYDATIYYPGIKEGYHGEDYYSLKTIYFRGIYPKQVYMYWRRFKVSDIPYNDAKEFEQWIRKRWYEKDDLLEHFKVTGKWRASADGEMEEKRVPVRLNSIIQMFQIFAVPLNVLLVGSLMYIHLLPALGLRS